MNTAKLQEAIDLAGGVSALAGLLGVRQSAVSNWRKRGVPLRQAIAIESATEGKVIARDICPEMFPSNYAA